MIEDRKLWVGDIVQVPDGRGVVEAVETWRSKIDGMREAEARAFNDRCLREVGHEYKTTWGRALVVVGMKRKWWPFAAVAVVEGRDGKADRFTTAGRG